MTRKRSRGDDPVEHRIELVLNPGAFIPDRACFEFVGDLEEVAAEIAKLVGSDPGRAAMLYETFLAACYVKIEELDDSSGSFGQFVGDLYCGWIKARQCGGADPQETASRLLRWMEQDDYGFCYRLETHAVEVFDKPGLVAFADQVRARFDAATGASRKADGEPLQRPEYVRRRWGEVLRTLYLAQKDVAAYVSLTEETGLTAKDCHAVATLLVSRRKPEEALSWVDRGIEIDEGSSFGSAADCDLPELRRAILTKLGRGEEALDDAWAEFRRHPNTYTYDELMEYVPADRRAEWHEKAIGAAMGADLHSLMGLLFQKKEWERLAELVRRTGDDDLEHLSHYVTEPVAEEFEKTRPDLAARLWRAQGLRIVNARKSKYYGAALSSFERARHCFERAGLEGEWNRTVDQVRAEHKRKSGFMPGFERLVQGVGPSDEPTFLERAKARWNARERSAR